MVVKTEESHNEESDNVEYVSEQLELKGAALEAFSEVFSRFQSEPEETPVRISFLFFRPSYLSHR